jgi:hypothetical protein
MARSPSGRRGRGASDLGGTLGSLLRNTWAQAGAVREVLERGARSGRARLDEALGDRRRTAALAELGDIVLGLVRQGEIDLEELPEIRDTVELLERLDADSEDRGDGPRDRRRTEPEERPFGRQAARPPTRRDSAPRRRDAIDAIDANDANDDDGVDDFDNFHDREGRGGEVRADGPDEWPDDDLHDGRIARHASDHEAWAAPVPRGAGWRGHERGQDDGFGASPEEELTSARREAPTQRLRTASEPPRRAEERRDRRREEDDHRSPTDSGPRHRHNEPERGASTRGAGEGDGTVSSSTWRPQPFASQQRVWRPVDPYVRRHDSTSAEPPPMAADRAAAGSQPDLRMSAAPRGPSHRDPTAPEAVEPAADKSRPVTVPIMPIMTLRPMEDGHAGPMRPLVDDENADRQRTNTGRHQAPRTPRASTPPRGAAPGESSNEARAGAPDSVRAYMDPQAPHGPTVPVPGTRLGGISFDDDLEEYMHADDVPKRGPE